MKGLEGLRGYRGIKRGAAGGGEAGQRGPDWRRREAERGGNLAGRGREPGGAGSGRGDAGTEPSATLSALADPQASAGSLPHLIYLSISKCPPDFLSASLPPPLYLHRYTTKQQQQQANTPCIYQNTSLIKIEPILFTAVSSLPKKKKNA